MHKETDVGPGQPIRACLDLPLTEDQLLELAERAVAEHAVNAPPGGLSASTRPERVRLALLTGKAWTTGRTLRIGFLDGTADVHARVEAVAREWERHANIHFAFGAGSDAEIRIAFEPGGSWSHHGTDALSVPLSKATMNLGWLTPETDDVEYSRVVLHEFGHALGCIHEHQSPAAGISWNKERAYAYYEANGWSVAQVDYNVFRAYEQGQTQFTTFDRASIMIYPVPRELTTDGFEVTWNSALSETDIRFIGERYPFPDASAPQLELGVATSGEIGAAGAEEEYRFAVDAPGSYVLETTGSTDVVMTLFGPHAKTVKVAEDDDSGLGRNAKIDAFLREGMYYVLVRHKRPTGTGRFGISLARGP